MHGLINRSIQCFVRDIYGGEIWAGIAQKAELGFEGFEALMTYDDALTHAVLRAAADTLCKHVDILLEDLGTYLVSHPNMEPLRRLLRFGGETYLEFLLSLGDVQGRARLAVAELEMPVLELQDHAAGQFTLNCTHGFDGVGHVFLGILRTLADDYGSLVLLEHLGRRSGVEAISIQVLDMGFAAGREFDLAAGAG